MNLRNPSQLLVLEAEGVKYASSTFSLQCHTQALLKVAQGDSVLLALALAGHLETFAHSQAQMMPTASRST